MHKTGTKKSEEETSKFLNAFLNVNLKLTVENIRRVALELVHVVEHLGKINMLVYHIEKSYQIMKLLPNLPYCFCKDFTQLLLSCVITILFALILM